MTCPLCGGEGVIEGLDTGRSLKAEPCRLCQERGTLSEVAYRRYEMQAVAEFLLGVADTVHKNSPAATASLIRSAVGRLQA